MTQETTKKIRAVHFGAGNIGRGLIAQIYQQNKFDIIFIDKNPKNISKFEKFQRYDINFFDTEKSITIKNFSLFSVEDEKKVIRWLRKATIVSTSIGVGNLDYLVDLFEKAYKNYPLDQHVQVICFENGYRISTEFRKKVKKMIKNDSVDFLDVVVDRIVPAQNNFDWSIKTESFYEIIADGTQHRPRTWLSLSGVKYSRNLNAYIHRKLILVNAAHTLIGLLGHKYNYELIENALKDQRILNIVKKYQYECIDALLAEHPEEFTKDDLKEYAQQTLLRFVNPNLKDSNERVIRNPITKMQTNERFMMALNLALKHNLQHDYLLLPFVLLVNLDVANDKQSEKLKFSISTNGVKKTLLKYTSLSDKIIQPLLK